MKSFWVTQNESGLGESSHDIFYAAEVYCDFSANARIDSGEESGRDLDERNTASEDGCCEPAEVANHASAEQEDDGGGSCVGKFGEERGAAAREFLPIFAGFTGRNGVGRNALESCFGEGIMEGAEVAFSDFRVCDDEGAGRAEARAANELARLREKAGLDEYIVGAGAKGNVDGERGGHGSEDFRGGFCATRWLVIGGFR